MTFLPPSNFSTSPVFAASAEGPSSNAFCSALLIAALSASRPRVSKRGLSTFSARLAAHQLSPTTAIQRSEEHTSELQSLMRISYAVFCLKKKKSKKTIIDTHNHDKDKTLVLHTTLRPNNKYNRQSYWKP